MADQNLDCKDCNAPFVFTEAEQTFYAEKQLSAPKRCSSCRIKRRREREGGAGPQLFDATCAQCGSQCQVPFVPKEGREIFCKPCFMARQGA